MLGFIFGGGCLKKEYALSAIRPIHFEPHLNRFLFNLHEHTSGIQDVILLQAQVDQAAYADIFFHDFDIELPAKLATAVDVRKADFLAGRMLLKLAQSELGLSSRAVEIGENRAPVWPEDQRGSVSHTAGRVACVLTGNVNLGLGVDVEKTASGKSLEALRQQVLCEAERELIDASTSWPSDVLATLIFSAKETLFKAIYPQINTFFGFSAAVIHKAPEPDTIILQLTRSLGSGFNVQQQFKVRYRLESGYILTWLSVSA